MAMTIRVLLVDDEPDFLRSIRRFLEVDPYIEVVDSALSGREALEEIGRLQPDLVLMDIVMPGMSGLETTRRIKAQPGSPRVVLMTLYDDVAYRVEAEVIRADGFVSKTEAGVELLPFAHALFAGRLDQG
jgi:DNA-binding NarL/FixJ family response regulator